MIRLQYLLVVGLSVFVTQLNALLKSVLYRGRQGSCSKLHGLHDVYHQLPLTHFSSLITSDNAPETSDISSFLATLNPTSLTNTAILLAGVAYFAFEVGPQGGADEGIIDVLPSKVYSKKLAVFAKSFIAKDTVIGEVPGYVKTLEDFEKSKKDLESLDKAKMFAWRLSDSRILDPTTRTGQLPSRVKFFLGLRSVPAILSRVSPSNKARGAAANVLAQEDGSRVLLLAQREIAEGEELFVEDAQYLALLEAPPTTAATTAAASSRPGPPKPAASAPATMSSRSSGAEEKVVDPILVASVPAPTAAASSSSLASEAEAEAMATMAAMAEALSAEDQELYEMLLQMTGAQPGKKGDIMEGGTGSGFEEDEQEGAADSGGTGCGGEDWFLPHTDPSPTLQTPSLTDTSSSSASLEEDDIFSKLLRQMEKDLLDFEQTAVGTSSSHSNDAVSASQAPELTPQDISELEKKMGALSDEEVEKVFGSLRSSLQSSLRSEYETYRSMSKGQAKPPLTPPIPLVSEKDKKVWNELEGVLGEMFANPLGVWGEILKNPDKYMSEEEEDAGADGAGDMKKKSKP